MDFGFTEEQREVQTLARKILSEQVSAQSPGGLRRVCAAERFDSDLWRQLAEAGLAGVAMDEHYGGMGFGFTELALLIEEVGRSIAPVPVISHCVVAALPMQRFGSEAMREALLPAAAAGGFLLGAGTERAAQRRSRRPAGDHRGPRTTRTWCCSGVKTAVPFGAQADRILLAARHGA